MRAEESSKPSLAGRLTVVLLTFNCAHRIEPVVQRLLRLGVPGIAVDNGSKDGTADLPETHESLEVIPAATHYRRRGPPRQR